MLFGYSLATDTSCSRPIWTALSKYMISTTTSKTMPPLFFALCSLNNFFLSSACISLPHSLVFALSIVHIHFYEVELLFAIYWLCLFSSRTYTGGVCERWSATRRPSGTSPSTMTAPTSWRHRSIVPSSYGTLRPASAWEGSLIARFPSAFATRRRHLSNTTSCVAAPITDSTRYA